jgi:ABC-type arginine transport system ATPase subunit
MTVIIVTHESDVAAHAGRVVSMLDGMVVSNMAASHAMASHAVASDEVVDAPGSVRRDDAGRRENTP